MNAVSSPAAERGSIGWQPTMGNRVHRPNDAEIRAAAVKAAETGKLPSKAELERLNEWLASEPIAYFDRLTAEANSHAKAGRNQLAQQAVARAGEIMALGPFPGLLVVVRERLAAHNEWAKTPHYAALKAAYVARDSALAAWNEVERDENVTPEKKRRLQSELGEAAKTLNELVNSRDASYAALRTVLKPSGDPALPACDWRSFKI